MILNEINWLVIVILISGYLFTFFSSTFFVRKIIKIVSKKEGRKKKHELFGTGFVIGVCENFVVITFVLINEIIGLALIFTAKTIVRANDISKEPQYYLVGTMVNFAYSLFMAMLIRFLITAV